MKTEKNAVADAHSERLSHPAKHLYRLWVTLLVLSGAIALWFSGNALVGVWNYARLNAKTSAEVIHWQVRELSPSHFSLEADYQFTVQGVVYRGKTIFETPRFLNRYAAESYVITLDAKRWRMWYKQSDPTYSSMEREFPKKNCLQALLTVGVFAYFYFARNMLSKLLF